MRRFNRIFLLILLSLISCNSGYEKEDDNWAWISYDEASGKRISKIEAADNESFKILKNEEYAKDKNHVYLIGDIISGADPNTFETITNGYSKDSNNVFLDHERIIFANPKTFEVLIFPFSKDDSHIFCGTIPLAIEKNEIINFKITESDKLGFGMKSTMTLSHFIESYPEYKWLDTLGINGVIIGEWATAETKTEKFKGLKKSNKTLIKSSTK